MQGKKKLPTLYVILIVAVAVLVISLAIILLPKYRSAEIIFEQNAFENEMDIEFRMPDYPGVVFHCGNHSVTANIDGKEKIYIAGMPVHNLYLCDLNGDRVRELCATVAVGSGYIDYRIVVFDLADDMQYQMEDRFEHDYHLTFEKGHLIANRTEANSTPKDLVTETENGTLVLSDRKLTMRTQWNVFEGKRSSPQINAETLKSDFENAAASLGSGAISRQVRINEPIRYYLSGYVASIQTDIEEHSNGMMIIPLPVCAEDMKMIQYLIVLDTLMQYYSEFIYYDPEIPDQLFICTELRDCEHKDILSYYKALCSGETKAHEDTFILKLDRPCIYRWNSEEDLYLQIVG